MTKALFLGCLAALAVGLASFFLFQPKDHLPPGLDPLLIKETVHDTHRARGLAEARHIRIVSGRSLGPTTYRAEAAFELTFAYSYDQLQAQFAAPPPYPGTTPTQKAEIERRLNELRGQLARVRARYGAFKLGQVIQDYDAFAFERAPQGHWVPKEWPEEAAPQR